MAKQTNQERLSALVEAQASAMTALAGLMTSERTDEELAAMADWTEAVEKATDAMALFGLAPQFPAWADPILGRNALVARQMVIGFVPTAEPTKAATRRIGGTDGEKRKGGLSVSLSGQYSAIFQSGLGELVALVADAENIKADLRALAAKGQIVQERTPVTIGGSRLYADKMVLKYSAEVTVEGVKKIAQKFIILSDVADWPSTKEWLGL